MDIEKLRAFCLNLPGAQEDIKWGADLCFMIAGKMFCATSIDPPHKVSLKVTDEQFGDLTVLPGIEPAPYLARYNWVQLQTWDVLADQEWERMIEQSYQLVVAKLPKSKLKNLIG